MTYVITLARVLSGALAILGAAAVVLMLITISVDVVLRQTLGIAVPFTVEVVSRYYMVAVGFLALAWVDRRGGMITVELLGPLFRGWVDRINRVLVAALCVAAYAILAYTTWRVAMREFGVGSFVVALDTRLPVWPSYFIPPVAFGLATALGLLRLGLTVVGREGLLVEEPAGPADGPGSNGAAR